MDNTLVRKIYYNLRPLIPRRLQLSVRREIVRRQRLASRHIWPIDERAGIPFEGWHGWPDRKQFALVITHDVETANGQAKCLDLLYLEKELGFRSSFFFVPERYNVSSEFLDSIRNYGFEVGVHGLYHDGKLYRSRSVFQNRAAKINRYLEEWKAVGFRSPSMHHKLDWICDLNIEYDASTFDTDPFEPQPDGVKTIFPFWVRGNSPQKGYLELPYTLCQDFLLFVILRQRDIEIWKQKLEWIAKCGGMALVVTHPDYMNFDGLKQRPDEYSVEFYREFLNHIKRNYENLYWHALPNEVAHYCKKKMSPQ